MNPSLRFMADLGERAGKSFVQGFFGLWLANPNKPIDFDTLFTMANLKAGVVMAAMSIAFSLGGKRIGNPDSASVLPPEAQPPAPQPADPTLKPQDAAPPPAPQPAEARDTTYEDQVLEQLRLLIRPVAPPPAPAPPLAPPPVKQPLGLLDPHAVGGRDPLSEGNT